MASKTAWTVALGILLSSSSFSSYPVQAKEPQKQYPQKEESHCETITHISDRAVCNAETFLHAPKKRMPEYACARDAAVFVASMYGVCAAGGSLIGTPVQGLDRVIFKEIDASKIMKGDIIYFWRTGTQQQSAKGTGKEESSYNPWLVALVQQPSQNLDDIRVIYSNRNSCIKASPLGNLQKDLLTVARIHEE